MRMRLRRLTCIAGLAATGLVLGCSSANHNLGGSGSGGQAGAGATGGGAGIGGAGGAAGGAGGAGTGGAGGSTGTGSVGIDGVVVLQGTSVTLVKNGAPVAKRNAPVVAGRDALVRVLVRPIPGYTPHQLTGTLTVTAGGNSNAHTAKLTPTGPSSATDLATTFNFDVPGSEMTTDATFVVHIGQAMYPASGTTPFGAKSTKGPLELMIVPYHYTGNGMDTVVDTSQPKLDAWTQNLETILPVPSVHTTVHATVDYSTAIENSGTGWSTWLQALDTLRTNDNPASNVVYVGYAQLGTFNSFCGTYCEGALAGSPSKSLVVATFSDQDLSNDGTRIRTVNMIGVALGRQFAPGCGSPSNVDPAYPYSGGTIGVPGYDRTTKALLDPTSTHDVMTYCDEPIWISDYSFGGFFDGIVKLNGG